MDAAMSNGSGTGRVKTAANSVSQSAGGLSTEFKNFVADVEDLIKSSTSLSGDEFARLKGRLSERVTSAKEALRPASESVVARARQAFTATNDYVADEPWKAVGIGALLGFFIGVLVARR